MTPPRAPAQYHFDSWTVENGLPDNWLRGIRQTRDGYLWITTGAGVARFDGVRFKVFNRANTPAMTSDRFSYGATWVDAEGVLWLGTEDGGVIRYRDGVFDALAAEHGLPGNAVVRIDGDAEGAVWIVTKTGLARWQHGRLTRVAPEPGSPFNDHLAAPKNMGVDGRYFGLWRMDASGWQRFAYGRWSPLPLPPHLADPARLQVKSIVEDSRQQLWYNEVGGKGDYYLVSDNQLSVLRGFGGTKFICYRDRQGRLWLTDQDGRAALWKDGEFTALKGFSTPYVFKALEDREGTLWIATSNHGLYRFRERVVTIHKHPGGPQFNSIGVLMRDRAGRVWAGAGGLARVENNRFENFYREKHPRAVWHSANRLSALYEDADGTLWVGTEDGIARFRGGRLSEEGELSAQIKSRVQAIRRDRAGDLWFGSVQGLYRLRDGRLTRYTTADGLAGDEVRSLHEDAAGNFWVGTSGGLSRFANGRFSSLTRADGLSSNNVGPLYEDAAGVLWVGTLDGGLNRVTGDLAGETKITRYTIGQGLYDNVVLQIIEDDHGFFWIGCQSTLR